MNLLYLRPGRVGGTETYAAGLLSGLARVGQAHRYCVFVNQEAASWPIPDSRSFERVVCPIGGSSRWKRHLFEQVSLPGLLKAHAIDLVHSGGYSAPLLAACPSVVSIHDVYWRALRRSMPPARRLGWACLMSGVARRAARVIADSQFGRHEIIQAFPSTRQRIRVVPLATASAPTAPTASISAGRYALAFSNWSPHKNVARIVGAFLRAKRIHSIPHRLLVVGDAVNGQRTGFERGYEEVDFVGHLDRDSLDSLLGRAEFLVFASCYEGFGFPILEAMAAGVPVITSDRASMPEVAGGAALLCDPGSVEDIADKISRLAMDEGLRTRMSGAGLRRAAQFSWEQTARQTLAVYGEVVRSV